MASPKEISDRAIALTREDDRAGAISALVTYAGDQHSHLEQARDVLVKRIRIRSDDFPATSGLSLINAALSQVGSPGTSTWQPRKWRLPR